MNIKHTSLHGHHTQLGAKMAPFAGFDMPLQYNSVKEEVLTVRNNVGVFDVSHMGEFFVEGREAVAAVDYLITNDFLNAEESKAVYSPLCNTRGYIIDDLIAYKISNEKVLICVNAANIQKDWQWISNNLETFDCNVYDRSAEYSLLAIQGPRTEEVFDKLEMLPAEDLPYYSVRELKFEGEHIILARTGYTGEDGFEVFGSHQFITKLWDKLLANDVKPCGLAARDVLRLEACYPLYGHELSDSVTPLDSTLKWAVKLTKKNFIGKQALMDYTPKYRLVKLSLDKGIPRPSYPILNSDGQTIGEVTSGTISVVLNKGIAIARVEKDKFPENKKLFIQIRKNNIEASIHKTAFVTGGHK
ncbi:MAG: glycine cleavage system aminomethyltransferase GcvT [Bacteriovoracaceae bacterium]|nr:glycine cleavage system aminomethyltransferase GcvT [Bacteriovoracaceae bacterium]